MTRPLQSPASYDEIYSKSESYKAPYQRSGYHIIWNEMWNTIDAIKNVAILDVGCGTGQFAHWLYDKGIRKYIGFDFSPIAINIARKRCPEIDFRMTDAYDPKSYAVDHNTVICIETLEHFVDDTKVISLWKPKVRVLATVPNFGDLMHERCFANIESVRRQYEGLIEIEWIKQICDNFFFLSGVKK